MAGIINSKIQLCGVCGVVTSNGCNIESTNRNPETGLTEYANFLCFQCCSGEVRPPKEET
jgi:hypothetical protein